MNVDNTEEFRCISLCSGYAGIELGLKRVIPTLRTVAYVEVEAFACTNLVAKIEEGKLDAAPVWTDIKTFPAQYFRDRVHIITGGYPCQPFSVAGQRKGTDDPRHLWPYIERIIQTVRPVWCFFENVSGHLTLGFPEVYRSLRLMGYKVEAGLFTAAECGAPHRRERLFILANSEQRWGRWTDGISGKLFRSLQTQRPSQLGNSTTVRPCGLSKNSRETPADENRKECGVHEPSGTSSLSKHEPQQKTMADSNKQRLEGCEITGNTESQRQGLNQQFAGYDRWPARPGQSQYEWEEPRVVADNSRKINRKSGNKKRKGQISEFGKGVEYKQRKRQAQSRLGGTVNGFNSRVDRLRLLGNGVVPQCAEKAFITLMELFEK